MSKHQDRETVGVGRWTGEGGQRLRDRVYLGHGTGGQWTESGGHAEIRGCPLRCGTFLEEGGKSSMFVLAESLQSGLQTVSQSHREGTAEA